MGWNGRFNAYSNNRRVKFSSELHYTRFQQPHINEKRQYCNFAILSKNRMLKIAYVGSLHIIYLYKWKNIANKV